VRTHRSTVLLGALAAAGLVMTQQACSTAYADTAEPVDFQSSSAPAPAGSAQPGVADDGDIFTGARKVVIKPNPSFEEILAVDPSGRLNATDGSSEFSLFVLTPHNGKFLIKTAKAGAGGERACMGLKKNGSRPLTVVATACDASRAGQLFSITEQKEKDPQGKPTYAISSQSAFLQIFPNSGLIAEELGDAPLATTFSFVDNGPSGGPIED